MSDKVPKKVPEELIRQLSKLLKTTDLSEIELSYDDFSVRVKGKESPTNFVMGSAPAYSAPVFGPATTSETLKEDLSGDLHIVRSPFVGTFYRSSSPTADPFVSEGQNVSKGQTLCIIEAMKVMNEIECDSAGTIDKVYVDNGTPIEYNTPLFGIRK